MPKKRKNVTLDPVNYEYLADHPNASDLVNRLVTEYRRGGGAEAVILDYRIEEMSQEVAMAESAADSKREQLEELKDRKERLRDSSRATVREFVDKHPVPGRPPAEPDNLAIKEHTPDGMTPEEFAEAVELERENRGVEQ